MKKTLLVLAILSLLFIQKTNAQLQKGSVLVGGDIADFDIGLRKNAGYSIEINPKAAWFINNNIAVGPYVLLGVSKANKASATVFDYGVGALGRYYLGTSQVSIENFIRNTRFFVEGNVGISGRNVSDGGGTTNGLGLGIGPGLAYFITPNVSLETLLKYNGMLGFGDATTQSDLNLSVGFQIYLPGRATQRKVMNDVK